MASGEITAGSDSMKQLLDLLPVLIAFTGQDGTVAWANRMFCNLSNDAGNGSLPRHIDDLLPGLCDQFSLLIHEVAVSGAAKTGIMKTISLPGSREKILRFDVIPRTGGQDPACEVILFALDVTDQEEMERLKQDANLQIEKNIEQFAVLGDRLRNPVTVITGLCDLLADTAIAEMIRAQAGEIDKTVSRMDQGWIESEKVRSVLRKYYDAGIRGTHELVARAIHEEYVAQQKSAGETVKTNPSMRPWNELPPSLQESNLEQADDIWRKLSRIQCAIGIASDSVPEPFEFTREEVELLAMCEHERWMDERIRKGWSLGPATSISERIHACLVPWQELPEDQKEKDRNAIRTLPSVLGRVRLKIVRTG